MKHTLVGASITRPSSHTNPIKKSLSLLLSLVMLISITAGLDLSAHAATSGDYEYTVLDDGTAEITQYIGSASDLTIPSKLGNYNVTSIGDYAFSNCASLTSATVPDSVTNLGEFSFSNCGSLTNVTLSESVTGIGNYAFADCNSLSSITIPDSVTSIGDYAFGDCDSLTSITIPDGVVSIGIALFCRCMSLKSVTIPDSITSIGDYAFADCISLTSITIPDGVTSIGDYAFCDCTSITSVTIPNSVTHIGDRVFVYCERLAYIDVNPSNKNYSSQDGILFNIDKSELIQYPAGNTRTEYIIPSSVIRIADGAFCDCKNLIGIAIPSSVISIDYGAFCDCNSLTSITIPNSVKSIGDYAFADCISLTSIIIPDTVTSLCVGLFEGCSSLNSITIPDVVISIGNSAFYDCNKLTDVYYKGTEEQWNNITIGDSNECLTNAVIHYHTHIFDSGKITTPPSCVKQGYTTYICECGYSHVDDYVDATGHTPIVTLETVAPTCDTAGYTREVKCSVCGDVIETRTEISAIGHTAVTDNAVTATCTESGLSQGSHCSVCNTVFVEQETIPAMGHIWNSGKIIKSSTCTVTGTKTYTCTVCGETKTETIAKKAHTYKKYVIKATTKANGSIVTKCFGCGNVKSKSTIYYPKTITLSSTSYVYDGKVKKPTVTVKNSNGKTISSTNYTVTYPSGRKNVGKYTVTIKFKGNYSGTVKKAFIIKPKATTISKVTPKSKGFIVKWKKQATQTTGYQIQYSTSSKFSSPKTVTITKNSTTSKTIAKLKAKKKYYVRIRTYKTVKVNGKSTKIYSSWSKAKVIITKK